MADQLPNEYGNVTCPMPVLRVLYDDDGEVTEPTYERCGGDLTVTHERWGTIDIDGTDLSNDMAGPWKVECRLGHVLLVPDLDGNDYFEHVPFDPEAALRIIRTVHESWHEVRFLREVGVQRRAAANVETGRVAAGVVLSIIDRLGAASSPDGGEAHSEAVEGYPKLSLLVCGRCDKRMEAEGPGGPYRCLSCGDNYGGSGVAAPPDSDRGTEG